MSLLRLLSAGKSLVGLKESTGRYHLPSTGALPKFEAKKNPFRSGATASRPSELNSEDEQPKPQQPAEQPDRKSDLGKSEAGRDQMRNVISKLRGLWPRRKSGVKSSPVRGAAPLVQGELSLDRVKVVRNDLSDSDLEIVPAPSSSRGRTELDQPNLADPAVAAPVLPKEAVAAAKAAEMKSERNLKASATALVGRWFGAGKP